jgi:hypothetical protein
MIRAAYVDAAVLFVDTVKQVGPRNGSSRGWGYGQYVTWLGTPVRALLTVELYLAKPAASERSCGPWITCAAPRQGSPIQRL